MDAAIQLVLVSLCAWPARSEPLGESLRRRSSSYGPYAGEFSHEFEPYAYAAIPLHSPLPVLQILSPMPLTTPNKRHKYEYSSSAHRPVYSRPQYTNDYLASNSENDFVYEPSVSEPAKYSYAASYSRPHYQKAELSESERAPTILYARPTPHGGYVYRRPSGASRSPPKKKVQKESPVILRIHKYKVIKDDR